MYAITFPSAPVEIGGGFVEGQNAAVLAKGFGESQTNDQRGQDFLTGGTTTAHVQWKTVLQHHHPGEKSDDVIELLSRDCRTTPSSPIPCITNN